MGLLWDLFCRVVDNFGDVGVCWRLATDLATRGHRVRLWIDDGIALQWMAPQGHPGVEVLPWSAAKAGAAPGDVVVEALACDPPDGFIQAMQAQRDAPVWINLEYLSAESWVQRCHGLPSPRAAQPGAGLLKWFFHPGFSADTGGLIREPGVLDARAAFERGPWLKRRLGTALRPQEQLVVVFGYESAPVEALLQALQTASAPALLAITPGATAQAFVGQPLPACVRTLHLPWLTQMDFDRLLWSADLNLVRGEDSVVRAIWAGAPFVWQLYAQDDFAHRAKAQAFLQTFFALSGVDVATADTIRRWWHRWNAIPTEGSAPPLHQQPLVWPDPAQHQAWGRAVRHLREALGHQDDLVTQLMAFVARQRDGPRPGAQGVATA